MGRLNEVVPTMTLTAATATTPTAAATMANPNQALLTMSSRRCERYQSSRRLEWNDVAHRPPVQATAQPTSSHPRLAGPYY